MIEILDLSTACSDVALIGILTIVKRMLSLIGTITPIVLITMSIINLVKFISNPDNKKYAKNIKNSVFAAIIVFFVPVIVNVVMRMLDDNFEISSCWNNVAKMDSNARYINDPDQERKPIYSDPSGYEKGKEKEKDTSGDGSGQTIEGTAQKVGDVVWDSGDITKKSNLTSSQLIGILNSYGGNAKNLVPYASGYITAENKYNINVFFMIGLDALESGWATSSISKSCNNLGGVCESSSHPSNGCGSNSNCNFAYFSSVNNFIDYHGDFLKSSYLTPGAAYYEGTDLYSVYTEHYCPGCTSGASGIKSIADGLFGEVSSVL